MPLVTTQHWRVRFSAGNGGDIWLAEVEFFDALGNKITTSPDKAISSGDYSAGHSKGNAFDGVTTDANSGWASTSVPCWIGHSFDSPVEVAEVRVYIAAQASAYDELPVEGAVYLDHSTDSVVWADAGFAFFGSFSVGGMLSGVPATPSAAVFTRSLKAIDLEFGGPDTVSGTTKRKIGDALLPQKAKVTLMRMRDKAIARQAWSDPLTGAVSFPGVDTARNRFLMLAEYPSNPDNPDADDYLRPVAGVALKRGES